MTDRWQDRAELFSGIGLDDLRAAADALIQAKKPRGRGGYFPPHGTTVDLLSRPTLQTMAPNDPLPFAILHLEDIGPSLARLPDVNLRAEITGLTPGRLAVINEMLNWIYETKLNPESASAPPSGIF